MLQRLLKIKDFEKEGMAIYVLEILLILELCCIFMYFCM